MKWALIKVRRPCSSQLGGTVTIAASLGGRIWVSQQGPSNRGVTGTTASGHHLLQDHAGVSQPHLLGGQLAFYARWEPMPSSLMMTDHFFDDVDTLSPAVVITAARSPAVHYCANRLLCHYPSKPPWTGHVCHHPTLGFCHRSCCSGLGICL